MSVQFSYVALYAPLDWLRSKIFIVFDWHCSCLRNWAYVTCICCYHRRFVCSGS